MRVWRVGAAALAVAALLCAFPGCASGTGDAEDATERFLLFSGAELSRTGSFLFGGFVWSPDGIRTEGFAVKTLAGAGVYRYRSGMEEITGRHLLLSVLPGWRFKQERFEANLFAGLDLQTHSLHPYDPGNRLAGDHAGIRIAGDVWWEPSPETMANGWASWSSVGASYAARGAFGWRLFDPFYLGPEAQALGGGSYRELRFGLHATAWRTGPFEWSAGLGYAHNQSGGAGAYMRLGLLTRR
jgi:hypothetical protein